MHNLPYDWTDLVLEDAFAVFGGIVMDAKFTRVNSLFTEKRGFGVVTFLSTATAEVALEAMNGKVVQGRIISVERAY